MDLITDLVYDVGVNNGDDTAYYLLKGYRVLGIEADPAFMPLLGERFAAEIATGQLTLLNVALAPERKFAAFWICDGYSLWNSFDRGVASRMGRKCHSIELECWPLRDIFDKYGVPYYLKMSLHGQEHFCLVDIDPEFAPIYLSLELPRDLKVSEEIMHRLLALGYHGFKIIDQTKQRQMVISPATLKSRLQNKLLQYPRLYHACESIITWSRRLAGPNEPQPVNAKSNSSNSLAEWVFRVGSSGPFGEDTHDVWHAEYKVRADWRAFFSGRTALGPPGTLIWYDLHATRMKPHDTTQS